MATISNIGGTGSSGYTAPVTAVTPADRLASGVQTPTPGVDAPLPFPTDPIDLNADGLVSQGEIAQSLRPRELVLAQEAPEQPALSTAAFAELAAPAEEAAREPAVQEADAQDPAVREQATATQQAAPEAPAAPPPTTAPRAAAVDTTSTATSAQTATANGSAIADAESAVTSLLGELASRSYGAVQSQLGRVAQPALSLVA